ncbi:MAG: ion transporter [Bacteroidales bacterium]
MYRQHLSKLEKKCNEILDAPLYYRGIETLVILSIGSLLLSTFKISEKYELMLAIFSFLSGSIFLVDYILRIIAAHSFYPHLNPVKARARYLVSFYGIIDFAVVLPFIVPFFFSGEHAVQLFELGRIFLLFKFARYSRPFKMVIEVFNDVKWELVASMLIMASVVFVCAVLMFYVEHKAQPDVFKNVGDSFWWAIITYTTVGYGDIYPITFVGKVLAGATALVGIAMVAFPTGIISTAFMRRINAEKKNKHIGKSDSNELMKECKPMKYCPHCGERLDQNHKE